MEILCIMGLFPKEYEEKINQHSKGSVQNAANKFQWGIVNGLEKNPDVNLKICNSLYIGSYPKRYKKLRIPSFEFEHAYDKKDNNIGYINLPIYKNISRYFGIKKEIDKWVRINRDKKMVILAYAMASPFVEILKYVKEKYPQIVCCLVVPDLPEYMNAFRMENKTYQFLKKIQIRYFKRMLKEIDCYVLLTEYMKLWFDKEIKYTVIEGIASFENEEIIEEKSWKIERNKVVLYAGMLEKKYGVLDLVRAFSQIKNDEWILELYGNGNALPEIEKLAKADSRIEIKGLKPNDFVVKKQKEAEILINPRNDKNAFTKYSFPSKIIEYMKSGTPMIGYKLSGMPKEYEKFFYCVNDEKNGLKKKLEEVMNLTSDERKKMGISAKEFVYKEKNAEMQCNKLVALLKNVLEKEKK